MAEASCFEDPHDPELLQDDFGNQKLLQEEEDRYKLGKQPSGWDQPSGWGAEIYFGSAGSDRGAEATALAEKTEICSINYPTKYARFPLFVPARPPPALGYATFHHPNENKSNVNPHISDGIFNIYDHVSDGIYKPQPWPPDPGGALQQLSWPPDPGVGGSKNQHPDMAAGFSGKSWPPDPGGALKPPSWSPDPGGAEPPWPPGPEGAWPPRTPDSGGIDGSKNQHLDMANAGEQAKTAATKALAEKTEICSTNYQTKYARFPLFVPARPPPALGYTAFDHPIMDNYDVNLGISNGIFSIYGQVSNGIYKPQPWPPDPGGALQQLSWPPDPGVGGSKNQHHDMTKAGEQTRTAATRALAEKTEICSTNYPTQLAQFRPFVIAGSPPALDCTSNAAGFSEKSWPPDPGPGA